MKVTLDRYIEITPDIRGGKPHIAGRRICVFMTVTPTAGKG
ncbi:MAG: DUF433 domain-containing protein [Pseudanabaena sp. ELA748]